MYPARVNLPLVLDQETRVKLFKEVSGEIKVIKRLQQGMQAGQLTLIGDFWLKGAHLKAHHGPESRGSFQVTQEQEL